MSDLTSNFESLLDSHKRLRSRAGMRELRDRRIVEREAVSKHETKEEARKRIFGTKSGPAAARMLMGLDDGDSSIRSAERPE